MANTTLRDNIAVGEPDVLVTAPAADPNSVTPGANTSVSTNLGAFGTSGDGRGFRFAYDGGTALVPGVLYQMNPQTTSFENQTSTGNATGDITVTLGSSLTATAGQFAGGFLVVRSGAGAGNTYSIQNNLASSASALTITLADPFRVATTSASVIDIYPNPYNGIVKMPTTATAAPVGAAIVATSGSQYAWVQTEGVIALQNDGVSTINPGELVAASVTTDGNVTAFLAGTTPAIVGTAVTTISGTNWGLVKLNLN